MSLSQSFLNEIRTRVRLGLDFLETRQLSSGGWPTHYSQTPDMRDGKTIVDVFSAAYIVREIAECVQTLDRGQGIVGPACQFLLNEQRRNGLWCFYSRGDLRLLPRDLDTTSCSAAALLFSGYAVDTSKITKVMEQYRHPRGGYWTWAMPPVAPPENWIYPVFKNDIDWGVNANIFIYFQASDHHSPHLLDYLLEVLRSEQYKEPTLYYERPLVFLSNLANGLDHSSNQSHDDLRLEIDRHVRRFAGDIKEDALDAALAVSTLLLCRKPTDKIESLISVLLKAQMPDYGWPMSALYYGEQTQIRYGSRELVTALAVKALYLVTRFGAGI